MTKNKTKALAVFCTYVLSVLVGFLQFIPNTTIAASSFSDHLWKFANSSATNVIDFNKGASRIYDNGDLRIATDNDLYLNAPNIVYAQKHLQVGDKVRFKNTGAGSYTGTAIYDNGQMHLVTDDHMFLDAPLDVTVANDLNVENGLTTLDTLTVNSVATFNSTVNVEAAATFDSTSTFNNNMTATAGVDFSGATFLQLPVVATALSDGVTACTSTGAITFTTNDNRLYVCDGSHWLKVLKGGD